MEKFSAHLFLNIGASLDWMEDALKDAKNIQITRETCTEFATRISEELSQIGCNLSAKAALRLSNDAKHLSNDEFRARARELRYLVFDEMSAHLFLWVPSHRSEYYSKKASDILGADCASRYPLASAEIEEAAKCYAVGQYTAAAFHLTRSLEAGLHALAAFINFTPQNNNWAQVFKQVEKEAALNPQSRPGHWQTHGTQIEVTTADLRAVAKGYRNEIAHLDAIYTEFQAKDLIAIIPAFLRHLASWLKEDGSLV